MENHKMIKWKPEEEEALRAGVAKHGTGRWKAILNDPEFSRFLTPHRSNVDLKDKWRNVISITPRHSYELSPRYNNIIFKAVSSNKEAISEFNSIATYIEQRYDVPHNFRKKLLRRLNILVSQGKLEQMESFYRIKRTTFELPKSNNVRPECRDSTKASENNSQFEVPSEVIESYSRYAAYRVAKAEHKSHLAAEAVKEAERISEMAAENEALLELAKEIYKQCSMGKVVLLD